jgi:hypothetical protein
MQLTQKMIDIKQMKRLREKLMEISSNDNLETAELLEV